MGQYTVPDLGYDYNALEPHIDARTMEIHHTKVHQAYVDGLNRVLSGTDQLEGFGNQPVEDVLWNFGKVPGEARSGVRNFGGGHANHTLFWTILSPNGGGAPSGQFAERLEEDFGSFEDFKAQFSSVAENHFGSGWVWLIRTRSRLVIYTLGNEDSPLATEEIPVLGVDLWEHAYYLQYETRRTDYIQALWNVVDWEEVGRRFEAAARG